MNSRLRREFRSGVTLVELLIVMSIIVLLAALTLPSFRGMLQGQKITQATRLVQTMIETAKSKAIAQGRPVAVIFDRVPVDASAGATFNHIPDNTVTRISLGEVFPPYEGDWAGASGNLTDANGDGVPDTLTIELAKVSTLYDLATASFTGLVDDGDLLQLGDHSQKFTITDLRKAAGLAIEIEFANPPKGVPVSDALWFGNTTDVRFRILRRPTKSLAGSTVLPRGMCVDLSQSGYGTTGNDFAAAMRGGTSFNDTYGPLVLVFSPRGTLEGSYYIAHTTAGYAAVDVTDVGVCHLLVGKVEQVDPTESLVGGDRQGFIPNLYDEKNFWISINPFNGMIYASPNAVGSATSDKFLDRQNARNFAIRVSPNPEA